VTTSEIVGSRTVGVMGYPPAARISLDGVCEISGLEAYSEEGKPLFPGDLLEQTRYAMGLIEQILGEAGGGFEAIGRLSVFTTDLGQWPEVWRELESLFQPVPAMTVVGIPSLVGDIAMIELEVTAASAIDNSAHASRPAEGGKMSSEGQHAVAILPDSLANREWELHAAAFVAVDGDLVLLSGIGPVDEDGSTVGVGDPAEQTRQIIRVMDEIMGEAGGTLDDIVRVRVFTTDLAHRPKINAERMNAFSKPRPVSTFIQVSELEVEDWLVEIEATAIVPRRR
jgi:2-iminobutanoate/2-iminopropanoate deaminase